MRRIEEVLVGEIRTAAIAGHVNPDGDCVGSCTALWQYIRKERPEIRIDLYLEAPDPSLLFMKGTDSAKASADEDIVYDLFITCDVSDISRIGAAPELFLKAEKKVCIDHHISNVGFADINHIEPDASSCSEVLANLMDESKIDRGIAESLYTGIIHDSGVFQYRNTSPETMRTAGMLISKGIDFNKIIDESFNQRTWIQNRILGYALEHSELFEHDSVIAAYMTTDIMESFHADLRDLSIIVSQLRLTKGVEAAVFIYQNSEETFKVSFRSVDYLDVSALAGRFGGGGHIRAAGCTIAGSLDEVRTKVMTAVSEAMNNCKK